MNIRNYFIVIIIFFLLFVIGAGSILAYDRITAERYLSKWWDDRNIAHYGNFDPPPPTDGGDCANFGSQCLIAGNILLDEEKFHEICKGCTWYRGCITGANTLKLYLGEYISIGHDKKDNTSLVTYRSNIDVADIIFWTDTSWMGKHTMIVNENDVVNSVIRFGSHYEDPPDYDADKYDESLQQFQTNLILIDSNIPYFYYVYLPDAPIIKQLEVKQNQGSNKIIIYKWNYDGKDNQNRYDPSLTTGDYYSHTYDGLSPWIMEEKIVNFNEQPLQLEIIFDQEMNVSNYEVTYGKDSPYNTVTATNFTWDSVLHTNDRLVCNASIPIDRNIAETINKISINAYSVGGGTGSQIDQDGRLDEYTAGINTKHRLLLPLLEIDKVKQITLNGQELYFVYGDINLQVKGLDTYKDYEENDIDLFVKFVDQKDDLIYDKYNPPLDKDDDVPYKIVWNTKQKDGDPANIDAEIPEDAKYKEGSKVKVQAKVYQRKPSGDFYMGSPTTKGIIKDSETQIFPFDEDYIEEPGLSKEIIIDNFRPYLKEVEVTQGLDGSIVKYHAKWGDPVTVIEENNDITKLKFKKIISADKNDEYFDDRYFIKAGSIKIKLIFSEDIAIEKGLNSPQLPIQEDLVLFKDFDNKEFYLRFNLSTAVYYAFENSPYDRYYINPGNGENKFVINKENEEVGFNIIEIETKIPTGDLKYYNAAIASQGRAVLGVNVKDFACNMNIPFSAQEEAYSQCDSSWCFNTNWSYRDPSSGEFPILAFILPGHYDTLHHFHIDPGPPTASLLSLFGSEIVGMEVNPGVRPSVVIEDELSKVAYVKIDWGDGKILEKIYDPPVDKVVEYNTYRQDCEDQTYTITVKALDAAGNEQNNIMIEGFEYPEVTFTVLARKATEYPMGFVANKAANTVTAINLDACGSIGQSIAQIPVGERPFDVASRQDGRIYVTNSGDGTLSVIDTHYDPNTDNFEFQEIDSPFYLGDGFAPSFIALTPDGSRAYIADQQGGVIKTVNLIYWTDFLTPGNQFIAIPPHSDLSQYNDIYEIPVNTFANGRIEDMAIDPAGRHLYVVVRDGDNADARGGSVVVINIEYVISQHPLYPSDIFHKILEVIPLERMGQGPLNEPSGIAFTPDGDLAFVSAEGTTEFISEIQNWQDGSGGIVVLDPQAVMDPAMHSVEELSSMLQYIEPHVFGSKELLTFLEGPKMDYTPFMGLGAGAGSSIIYGMQETYNTLVSAFDQTIYQFPVDVDGTESISISPDGRKAYVTFFNTNNYGIIDLEPSTDPTGFNAQNVPKSPIIYASTEAILPSLVPQTPNPSGWNLYPNEITLSRDGRFVFISNRGQSEDLVTIVDAFRLDEILGLLYAGTMPSNKPGQDYLNLDSLQKYPIDNLPTDNSQMYEGLTQFVGKPGGIDDPEGISVILPYDSDEDLKYGGSSDLVEAKNRFNSLLNLPSSLNTQTLISTRADTILSPIEENLVNHSQAVGCPWGDNENNYLSEHRREDPALEGKLLNGVLLPTEGVGYRHDYGYDPYDSDNAGTLELINLLEDVGRKWMKKHPQGPRIIYGDLSRPGGGQFMEIGPDGAMEEGGSQRHAAHQNGLDVDVQYMRSDFTENIFDFVMSNNAGDERNNTTEADFGYHGEYTRELIQLFLDEEAVEAIFVDPMVIELAEREGDPITNPRVIPRGERDGSENGSRRDNDSHMSIRIKYENFAPVARIVEQIVATEGDMVVLDGSASFDPEGRKLSSYQWTQKEGPEVLLKNPETVKPEFECPSVSDARELVFGLTVFDGEFWSKEATVVVRINGKPIADAGPDQTVEAGDEATLDGSGSYDPDGDEIQYRWLQIEGIPVHIEDFNQQTLTFIAPWDPSISAESITLTFSLIISDDHAESNMDTVVVTVKPNLGAVDLEIYKPEVISASEPKIPEAEELDKGSVTFVNLDNDDKDEKFDIADTLGGVPGGDDELVKIRLKLDQDLKEGMVTLAPTAGGGNIRIWKQKDKAPGSEYEAGALSVPDDFIREGNYLTKVLWVEGISAHESQGGTILLLRYEYESTILEDEVKLTVLGIDGIDWIGKGNSLNDSNILDKDVNWPEDLEPDAVRVFPDARIRNGIVETYPRNIVDVKVTLTLPPPQPIRIYLRSFDVDDPTSHVGPIDDPGVQTGETFEEDNRGELPARAGKFVGTLFDQGVRELFFDASSTVKENTAEFEVTMQPGDNFKVVGSGDKDFLYNLENNDQKLHQGENLSEMNINKQRIIDQFIDEVAPLQDREVPEAAHYCSKTLTVWRFMHVELDSMTAPPQTGSEKNFVKGTIIGIEGNGTVAAKVIVDQSLNDGSKDLDDAEAGNGRFENGWITIGTGTETIGSTTTELLNGNGDNFVVKTAGIIIYARVSKSGKADVDGMVVALNGNTFDLNLISGTLTEEYTGGTLNVTGIEMTMSTVDIYNNKVTVEALEDIPFTLHDDDNESDPRWALPRDVDTGYISPTDNEATNKFKTAFVRPIYDGGGDPSYSTHTVEFIRNTRAPEHIDWDSRKNNSERFWVVYVLSAFQDSKNNNDSDKDPDNESGTGGVTLNYLGGGSFIYLEQLRERYPVTVDKGEFERRVVAHEVGHSFLLDHGIKDVEENEFIDNPAINGIMNRILTSAPSSYMRFIDKHLHKIRDITMPDSEIIY